MQERNTNTNERKKEFLGEIWSAFHFTVSRRWGVKGKMKEKEKEKVCGREIDR
jgi:hypothetical protein